LGPALLIWTSVSIYHALSDQKDLPGALQQLGVVIQHDDAVILLLMSFSMMPVNWLLETGKWHILVSREGRIRFRDSVIAVLGGLALSMNTPNRIGEYFGRVLYLGKGRRFSGANYAVISGLGQLMMTLIAGTVAVFLLPGMYPLASGSGVLLDFCFGFTSRLLLLMSVALLFLLYFNYAGVLGFVSKISGLQRLKVMQTGLPDVEKKVLMQVLLISLIRFMIFTTQYLLIWKAFGITFDYVQGAAIVSLIYLIMAIIPTIAIAELGIRGKVALLVAGVYTHEWVAVTAGTVLIWLINIILPAVTGTLFLWNLKWNRTK
jgi:hypothetical protein